MHKIKFLRTFSMLVLFAGYGIQGPAMADDGSQSKDRQALRRAQQQIQQLKQDKAALEEKLTALDKEKSDLEAVKVKSSHQLSSVQANIKFEMERSQKLQASLEALTAEKTSVDAQNADLKSRLVETQRKQVDTEQQLRLTLDQKKNLESQLHANSQQLLDSDTKNFAMYKWSRELMDQCRDRSSRDVFLRLEPFTGIKRVGIENMLQEYRDRLDQERRMSADKELHRSEQ